MNSTVTEFSIRLENLSFENIITAMDYNLDGCRRPLNSTRLKYMPSCFVLLVWMSYKWIFTALCHWISSILEKKQIAPPEKTTDQTTLFILLYHQRLAFDKISILKSHKNTKPKRIKLAKSSVITANTERREDKNLHTEHTKISYFYYIIIRSLILWTILVCKVRIVPNSWQKKMPSKM